MSAESMSATRRIWPATDEGQAYLLGILAGGFVKSERGVVELELSGGKKRIARLFERLRIGRVGVVRGRVRVRGKHLGQDLTDAGLPLDGAWQLPVLPEPLRHAFVRGLFDVRAELPHPSEHDRLCCSLTTRSGLAEAVGAHYAGAELSNAGPFITVSWCGVNALDTLGSLYESATLFRKSRRRCYLAWASAFPARPGRESELCFRWSPCHAGAVAPFKARVSDSGYDLTLIREVKRFGSTVLYGSGIQVAPPEGWYFDVVPRSSIIKTGYIVANSVGVIDRSYRGEVMVPLVKIDPAAPELSLPARVAQMIPRPIVHLQVRAASGAGTTQRGSGGFGSTGS